MKKVVILSALVALLFSCKKDTTPVTVDNNAFSISTSGSITTVKNLLSDTIVAMVSGQPMGVGRYTFFSLENKALVPSVDSATTKWDLAFAGTTIRVNNVTSGPGSGGAFVYNGTFDGLSTIAADSTFKVDNHPVSYAILKGSGKGWYNYDQVNNLLTPIPGKVIVIRTASGKYAKVEILGFYKGGISVPTASTADELTWKKTYEQRYFSFRYTMQPNGTRTF